MSIVKLQGASGEAADIHLHGAQVTSWLTNDGVQRLFLSQRADFRDDVAIRGGVPVIFPQFAGFGALPKHGFARTARWQRVTDSQQAANCALFRLQDDAATRAVWPHSFVLDYSVTLLHDALRMTLTVRNTAIEPCSFTAALHTYLRVADIAQVRVQGLQGLAYLDSAKAGTRSVEADPQLLVEGEIDRIYLAATRPIYITEPGQRTMVCSAQGFGDVVLWNPGAEKAAQLADLEPGGYRHMLCVEAAVVGTPVELQPQGSWSGTQILQLESP